MKKSILLNSCISAVVADMGHTDTLAIGDCGLPIPESTNKIDLALNRGVPGFLETLETVLAELEVEKAILSSEIAQYSPELYARAKKILDPIEIQLVPHSEFKAMLSDAKAVIRTGECTAFANILLVSGVAF